MSGEAGRDTIQAMKLRVYVETTIPSYLTAWPSRDLIRAAEQRQTALWWARRAEYELVGSELLLQECGAGDPDAAAARIAAVAGLPVLEQGPDAAALAETLVRDVPLPPNAVADATHIALAAVHGIELLVTRGTAGTSPTRCYGRGWKRCAERPDTSRRRSARRRSCWEVTTMRETDVLADIRAVRDELAARYGGDAWALSRALAERSRAAGRTVVRFPPRDPRPPRVDGAHPPASGSVPLDSEAVA